MSEIRGHLHRAGDATIGIVASRFNDLVVERLVRAATDTLIRHGGIAAENITTVWVPGAFELPQAARRLASTHRPAGIVAVGCVIRGETPHFDAVVQAASTGLTQVSAETGIPLGFGLITAESLDQALDRAGGKQGNKGADAALAVLETIDVFRQIESSATDRRPGSA